MMKIIRYISGVILMLFVFTSPSYGAILNIENGILMGATGVNVNGSVYDVSFQDGTCISLFNDCDEISDFIFPDVSSVSIANLALLEQVFIDTSDGLFDTDPTLTNGCSFGRYCNIYTPIGFSVPTLETFSVAFAVNSFVDIGDSNTGTGQGFRAGDTTLRTEITYALWSGSSQNPAPNPVPLPNVVWLFGVGLLGLVGMSKKVKKPNKTN